MKHTGDYYNKELAKKYGMPLNASYGDFTKAKSAHKAGGKNASIMANPNTKSDRAGYAVNGVGGNTSHMKY